MTCCVAFVHATSSTIRNYSKSRSSNFRALIILLHYFYIHKHTHTYIHTSIRTYIHTDTYIYSRKWRAWMLACHLFLLQNIPVKCTLYTFILCIIVLLFFPQSFLHVVVTFLANFPKIGLYDLRPLCKSESPSHQILNAWTNTSLYETWYIYHGAWSHLKGVLYKSLLSLSVSVCISPYCC
jgi:hypothetical protein